MTRSTRNWYIFILAVVVVAAIPMQGLADRLYTWTDDKGVSHITKTPPPAGARKGDIIEYSHRTHEEQKAAAASSKQESTLQQEAEQVVSGDGGRVEQYLKEIRNEMQQKAAEGKESCYLQAPDRRVYVRVFSTNSYGERNQEIWKGWIEPDQQAFVISPTETVLFSSKWEEMGPFSGDNLRSCSGGGIIRITR
jgi:hypothetical protein